MQIITKIAKAMQDILTTNADIRAKEVGFIKRQRKFSGSTFAQTLVFGWLNDPEATLEDLTQTAADLGVSISPQGLEKRFTYEAADFLKHILEDAVGRIISAQPVGISILQRFHGVYIKDSSIVALPDELHDIWQGCGGRVMKNTRASVKMQLRVNMNTGGLDGPYLYAGRTQDKNSPFQYPPAGSLEIFDLGYFSLKVMEDMDKQDVFWLSRIHTQCDIYHQGERRDLVEFLETHCFHELDVPVLLGVGARLPCRLLAVRVPDKVSRERRRKIRAKYKREGKTPSKRHLALTNWTIMVTNVSCEQLTLEEAFVLKRVRWQIELLFKLWKSHGSIDEWRTENPMRILCEFYAKLVAMIIQHWIILCGCWHLPERSLVKAAKVIRKYTKHLSISFAKGSLKGICEALSTIQNRLAVACRMNSRRKRPNTYQLLLQYNDSA
jgi:hypothetical protein